ncbi:hypothetical protein AB0J21_19495 [Streptomyces sp. NPDC049954]|uniref:hypothetical protein n=1 Tax=Streptomyces sp. NPDC049954 TaxID=3155779 RepID=UPI003417D8CF
MNAIKKLTAGAGAAVAAGTLALSLAPDASAAPQDRSLEFCTDAYMSGHCQWFGGSGVPTIRDMVKDLESPYNFQDAISSVQNYSGQTACMWTDNGFKGIQGVFQDNYTWNTLSYPYDNSISSMKGC